MSTTSNRFAVSRFVWLAVLGALVVYWITRNRTPAPALSLPPNEDAFVSYYQAVHGLAEGLSHFKTRGEFQQQAEKIDPFLEQLDRSREEFLKLSAEDRDSLSQEHEELVERAKKACQQLEQRHAKQPKILDDDWDWYWDALQLPENAQPANENP